MNTLTESTSKSNPPADDENPQDDEYSSEGADGDMPMPAAQRFKNLLAKTPVYKQFVTDLARNGNGFKLVTSLYTRNPARPNGKKILCILDSSFNPPTLAHLELALRAVKQYTPGAADTNTHKGKIWSNPITPPQSHDPESSPTIELLLLLATTNVDKKPQLALFEDRLTMMSLLAKRVRETIPQTSVHIGITPHARFIDKSIAVAEYTAETGIESPSPSTSNSEVDVGTKMWPAESTQQVWILGYDTITRLFSKKYYPPDGDLTPVYTTLLSGTNRLLIMLRPDVSTDTVDLTRLSNSTDTSIAEQEDWIEENLWRDQRIRGRYDVLEPSGAAVGVSSTVVRKGLTQGGNKNIWQACLWAEMTRFLREVKVYDHEWVEKKEKIEKLSK